MAHREVLKALSGLLLALLVAILSSTIVANALPTIVADLHGTQAQYTWVVTATLLASTATTPLWGKLSDLFSKKLLYQVAIVIFSIGSVLSGLSESMGVLIGFRALQGVGMGGLQALAQVVIAAMVSPRERGRYNGYTGAVMAVATVGGPLAGGVIVDTPWLGWRWCFFVVVPLAVLALAVIGRTLRLPVERREVRIDWAGATLITGGVSLLLVWVSLAGRDFDWLSLTTLAYLAGALLCLLGALMVEARVAEPVIPLRLFRDRTIVLAVTASVAVGVAMFGSSVFLGQYFQLSRGFSPTKAGLLTLPMVAGLFLASTVSGQIIARTGRWKAFLVGGTVLLVAGLGLLGTIDHGTNLWVIGVFLLLIGVGIGMSMQNLVLAVQNSVPAHDLGAASSVVTFFRSLGGAAGVSVLGSVFATRVTGLFSEGLSKLHLPAGSGSAGGGTVDIAHLPGPVQGIMRAAYGDAAGTIFAIAAVLAVLSVVATLLIKEVPLRTSSVTGSAQPAGHSGGQGSTTDGSVHEPVDNVQEIVDNSGSDVDNLLRHPGDRRAPVVDEQTTQRVMGLLEAAERVLVTARAEADRIVTDARAEAEHIRRNAETDVRRGNGGTPGLARRMAVNGAIHPLHNGYADTVRTPGRKSGRHRAN
nr:MFS transporter [Longimycelium tulufanense]